MEMPARGVAAFSIAIRFASASTIRCRSAHLVEVEPNFRLPEHSTMRRALAMPLFRTQSAAEVTSLAPHGSKARLQPVTNSRRFMAKPCTPHPIPQAAQLFELQTANVRGRGGLSSSFSGGSKGGVLFGKRIPPLTGSSAHALHSPSALCAEKRIPPARQPPFTPPGVKQFRGVLCQKNS